MISVLSVSAFWAYAVFIQSNAAERAAIHAFLGFVFLGRSVDTAGESDFGNIEFVLQQVIHDLDPVSYTHLTLPTILLV